MDRDENTKEIKNENLDYLIVKQVKEENIIEINKGSKKDIFSDYDINNKVIDTSNLKIEDKTEKESKNYKII